MRVRFDRAGQVDAGNLHLAIGKTPSAFFRAVDGGTAVHPDVYLRVYVRYAPNWVGGGANKMSRAQSLPPTTYAQAMSPHAWSSSRPADHTHTNRLSPAPSTAACSPRKLPTR